MAKIELFDEFANKCKHFYNANKNINNGYNCKHKKQQEKENKIGKCYCFSCPLGCEADEEDFEDLGIDNKGHEYSYGQFILLVNFKELLI